MKYTKTITVDLPFDTAVARVREALAGQGFGILTEIDVTATLKAKLDETIAPQLILGACNPQLAHRALQIEPRMGVLLPCNVVVREQDGVVLVEALDPAVMVSVPERPELQPVADEAATRLQAVLDALSQAR